MYTHNILLFADVDGTLIDTEDSIVNSIAKTISSYGHEYENVKLDILTLGIHGTSMKYLGVSQADFLDNYYESFDIENAAATGSMKLFPDALHCLETYDVVAISNARADKLQRKLSALDITDAFMGIHGAPSDAHAKPSLYLAKQAINELKKKNLYDKDALLIYVGDQPWDVEFGHNIKQLHPNTLSLHMKRREKFYDGPQADGVITSLDELKKYRK